MVDYDKKYFLKDGKGYVVRYFDCEDNYDLRDLILTVESPEVQRWMDNVNDLNFVNYRKWMDEKGEGDRFLYAIADPKDANSDSRVHGFVYIYPNVGHEGALEVSYAKRPGAPAGLTSPALSTACSMVTDYLKERNPLRLHDLKFVAEIERDNVASIKVVEKIGFKRVGEFDSKNEAFWVKNLGITEDFAAPDEKKEEKPALHNMGRVKQDNGSYCGPAVLQILLSHFGIEAKQEDLVAAGSSREQVIVNGMSLEKLAEAVHKLYPEMSFWEKREANLFDIEKLVREFNYPVAVNWQGYFEENEYEAELTNEALDVDDPRLKGDEGHYSVVIDLDRSNNNLRIMDPYGHYSEKDRFFEIQDFLERWWDDRMDVNLDGNKNYVFEKRLMFVIVPKGVRVPEVLGMVEV